MLGSSLHNICDIDVPLNEVILATYNADDVDTDDHIT